MNEPVRGYHSQFRMFPAGKGLHPDNFPAVAAEERLIEDKELSQLYSAKYTGLHLHLLHCCTVHLFGVKLETAFSRVWLDLTGGKSGVVNKGLTCSSILREEGYAYLCINFNFISAY